MAVITNTLALFASGNPTLNDGDYGFESDTGHYKLGDGATAWNDLTYYSISSDFTRNLVNEIGTGGASPLTTKGDLYTYSTADARLPVGNDGMVLVVDSGEATGLRWAYPETSAFRTFMFANIASDIPTYYDATTLPSYVVGALGDISTAGVSTTPTLLGAFATDSGFPNVTTIPVGLFYLHFETKKVAGANNYYCYAEIYKRVLAGTETLLLTTDNTTQSSVNTIIQQTVGADNTSEITLLATDRIVVKIYGVMLSSTATIHLYFDDNTDARLEIPSLSVDASNFVPYTGATLDVNLGTKNITANNLSGTNTGDLVSGTTIKTINGASVLGAGDLVVSGALPDVVITKLVPALDQTITAGYSCYYSGYYEIADTKYLEIGEGSTLEIG